MHRGGSRISQTWAQTPKGGGDNPLFGGENYPKTAWKMKKIGLSWGGVRLKFYYVSRSAAVQLYMYMSVLLGMYWKKSGEHKSMPFYESPVFNIIIFPQPTHDEQNTHTINALTQHTGWTFIMIKNMFSQTCSRNFLNCSQETRTSAVKFTKHMRDKDINLLGKFLLVETQI